jgi:CAAX prenyl protease-like protein
VKRGSLRRALFVPMLGSAKPRYSQSIVYSLPFAIYVGFLIIESVLARGVSGAPLAFDLRWLYAIKAICVGLALVFLWRHYTELAVSRLPSLPQMLLAFGAGFLVLVLWVNMTWPWAVIGATGEGFDPRRVNGELNWSLVGARILGASLVVPLMEEIFWRSFVMRWLQRADFLALRPDSVGVKALLLSSLVFGFEHSLWFAGIVAGLVYGWLYIQSRNLWVPVLAHAVTNGGLGVWVVYTGSWHFW